MVNNNQRIGSTGTLLVSKAVRKSFSPEIAEGRCFAKLAQTPAEVESALRLRYEVSDLELAAPNGSLGIELEPAKNAQDFYAHNKFSLEDLSIEILSRPVEIGRSEDVLRRGVCRRRNGSCAGLPLIFISSDFKNRSQKRSFTENI